MTKSNWKNIFLYLLIVTLVGQIVYIGAVNYKFPKGKVLSESVVHTIIPVTTSTPFYASPLPTATTENIESLIPGLVAVPTITPSVAPSSTHTPTLTPTPKKTSSPTSIPSAQPSPVVSYLPTPSVTPDTTISPTPFKTPTSIPLKKATSQEINSFIDRFAAQYAVDPNVIRHIALCESGFNPLSIHLSYYGLFQFGPDTWQSIRKKMGEDTNLDLRLNAEEAVQTAAYKINIGGIGIWPNCKP